MASVHPVHVGRASRTKEGTGIGTWFVQYPGVGEAEGDLLVLQLGTRATATVFGIPSSWTVLEVVNSGDGSSPAVFMAWKLMQAGETEVPVTFDRDTNVVSRFDVWEKDSFSDWMLTTGPVDARVAQRGNDNAYNPPTLTFAGEWTASQPGSIKYKGGAGAAHRANTSTNNFGGNWSVDTANPTVDGGNSTGVRGPSGLSINSAGTAWNPDNGTLNGNAFITAWSYAVRGKYPTKEPEVGPGFTYQQQIGSTAIQFTCQHEELNADTTYLWDFGDTSPTSDERNPVHTFIGGAGNYTVTLTTENSANDAPTVTVIVITVTGIPPVAAWTYLRLLQGHTIQFIDESLYADSWLWEMYDNAAGTGIPTTYTDPNPKHDFGAVGQYLVRLTVTNVEGSDALERTIELLEPPEYPERNDGLIVDVQVVIEGEWRSALCDVQNIQWAWGTDEDIGVLSQPKGTGARVLMADPERTYDSDNTSSPLYGKWTAGTPIRVVLSDGVSLFPFWSGFITNWTHDMTFAEIEAVDWVQRLADYDIDLDGEQAFLPDTTGSRITALLDVANWPSSRRDVQAGGTLLQATTVSDQSVWATILDSLATDLGKVFPTPDGTMTYRTRPTTWNAQPPHMVLGCDPPDAVADVGLDVISVGGAVDVMVNEARVAARGGEEFVYTRPESIGRYGRYTAVHTDLLLAEAELSDWADFILDRQSEPSYQGRRVAFWIDASILPKLASLEFGDIVRIYDDTHEGSPIDMLVRVLGITWVADPNVVHATMLVQRDAPLAEDDQSSTIDTDTEWAASVRAENVLIDGTGTPAIITINKTEP